MREASPSENRRVERPELPEIDFRPAFITDQGNAATKSTLPTASNGLTYTSNNKGIESVQVVFFNWKALPLDANGGVIGPYLGVGPKIPQLID